MQTKLQWEALALLSKSPCYKPASLTHMKKPLCLYLEDDIPVAYWTAQSFQTVVAL